MDKRNANPDIGYFVLAGGLGTRARPLSLVKPKPAFPLNGTPLLSIMLEHLNSHGLSNGFINTHYMPEAIRGCVDRQKFPHITWLHEQELSGSLILKEALPTLAPDELLLVVNGDIFLDVPVEAMKACLRHNNSHLVLLVRPKTGVGDDKYLSLVTENDVFIGREKTLFPGGRPNKEELDYMYTGVALFTRHALETIRHISFFDSFEAKPGHIMIHIVPYSGIWLDIGDPETYREADRAYKKHMGIRDPLMNSLSPNVSISVDSNVTRSIIWENTRIVNGSSIENCIITGNCRLDNVLYKNQVIPG